MTIVVLAHLLFALLCWKRERSRRRRLEARDGTAIDHVEESQRTDERELSRPGA